MFGFENDNRRTGSPTSVAVHDFGLSTVIGKTNRDAKGNTISLLAMDTIRRIRTQDQRSQINKSTDTNLAIAFDMLHRIQDKIGVSDNTKELAAYIYRKSAERKITRGRPLPAMVAASMYAACRNTQLLRTLRDISEATNIKRRTISQSYRAIVKTLGLKIPVVDQTHCILKISNNLRLQAGTKHLALKIIQRAEAIGMVAGRDPVGISAAAVCLACILKQVPLTQVQIARASGVTDVTIRNRFHEIQKRISVDDLL